MKLTNKQMAAKYQEAVEAILESIVAIVDHDNSPGRDRAEERRRDLEDLNTLPALAGAYAALRKAGSPEWIDD